MDGLATYGRGHHFVTNPGVIRFGAMQPRISQPPMRPHTVDGSLPVSWLQKSSIHHVAMSSRVIVGRSMGQGSVTIS